ncbi:MAG: formate--tetrahydrofolate ligase, partial [Chloroflexi bacterium]|nr:formate--tetrahydrofolate ligase [Chloroflexota bacterium]
GARRNELDKPNEDAVQKGMTNLTHLIGVIKSFSVPVVVAMNHFPTDTPGEMAIVKKGCEEAGAFAAVESRVFAEGGAGGVDLGEALIEATRGNSPDVTYLYPEDASLQDKVLALAKKVYNADDVSWPAASRRLLRRYEELGWGNLPVCMAKTHLSISHNPNMRGKPSGYTFELSDVRASVGAGFIYPIAGTMVTMPGLPGDPRALDVDDKGNILGLVE